MRHLAVVTYARSGSTLLMGLLNTLPGVLVRGENTMVTAALHDGLRRLEEAHGRQGVGPTGPWFGADLLDLDAYLADAGRLLDRQLLGGAAPASVDVLGFKEVRWEDTVDVAEHLGFLERMWPGLLVLAHTRCHRDVAASAWRAEHPEAEVAASLRRVEDGVAAWDGPVTWTSHEDVVADPVAALGVVAAYLGVPAPDPDAVRTVAATRHSYS